MAELATAIRAGVGFATRAPEGFDAANPGGNPAALADVLFRDYFFPFEVTSVLLIVAAVAAMVLALRRTKAITQREVAAHAGDDLEAYAMAPPGGLPASTEGPARMRTPIAYFLLLSAVLFALGSASVLLRRNALRIFMGVELQLNAVNLTLVAFSRMHMRARRADPGLLLDGGGRGRGGGRARDHRRGVPAHGDDRRRPSERAARMIDLIGLAIAIPLVAAAVNMLFGSRLRAVAGVARHRGPRGVVRDRPGRACSRCCRCLRRNARRS